MLTTLIAIAGMFTIVLITHNYALEAIHRDALGETKPHHKSAD